jgi:hypothetical protein
MVRKAARGTPAVETRSAAPVTASHPTQPVSDIPPDAPIPAVPFPASQDDFVSLPVPHPPAAETPIRAAEKAPPTVLLVDRDAAMRKMLAMLLNREGYCVRHAADSGEATAALSANGVDVVVANLSYAEQPVVIRKWLSVHPNLSIITLSNGIQTEFLTSRSNLLTLPLPSRPSNVVQAVQALLENSRA